MIDVRDAFVAGLIAMVTGAFLGSLISFSFVRADCNAFGKTTFNGVLYACTKDAK